MTLTKPETGEFLWLLLQVCFSFQSVTIPVATSTFITWFSLLCLYHWCLKSSLYHYSICTTVRASSFVKRLVFVSPHLLSMLLQVCFFFFLLRHNLHPESTCNCKLTSLIFIYVYTPPRMSRYRPFPTPGRIPCASFNHYLIHRHNHYSDFYHHRLGFLKCLSFVKFVIQFVKIPCKAACWKLFCTHIGENE